MSSLSDVYRDVIPLPITVDSHKACSINDDTLLLRCHSFLSVFVTNVTYGRTASKVYSIKQVMFFNSSHFRELSYVMETSPRMPSPPARIVMMTALTSSCWTWGGQSAWASMTV